MQPVINSCLYSYWQICFTVFGLIKEAVWDMIEDVLFSALLVTMYQAKYRVLNRRWIHFALLLLLVMAAISLLIFCNG